MQTGTHNGGRPEDYGDYEDYDESSSLEEELRKLDDLLDQGLITQQDYDREKRELFEEN